MEETDTAATTQVAVVDETLARRFWPNGSAMGHEIRLGNPAPDSAVFVRTGRAPVESRRMIKGFFFLIAVLGLTMAAFGVYFILYSSEATSWPSVEGRIVRTTIGTYTGSTPSTAATASARERLRTYFPRVTYRWTVDAQSYEGSRYSLGEEQDDFPERAEAEHQRPPSRLVRRSRSTTTRRIRLLPCSIAHGRWARSCRCHSDC